MDLNHNLKELIFLYLNKNDKIKLLKSNLFNEIGFDYLLNLFEKSDIFIKNTIPYTIKCLYGDHLGIIDNATQICDKCDTYVCEKCVDKIKIKYTTKCNNCDCICTESCDHDGYCDDCDKYKGYVYGCSICHTFECINCYEIVGYICHKCKCPFEKGKKIKYYCGKKEYICINNNNKCLENIKFKNGKKKIYFCNCSKCLKKLKNYEL
jgi:hypothetical protein